MGTIVVENMNIEAHCRCTLCQKLFLAKIKSDNIHSYTLTKMYEDTDDGFVLQSYVTCPHCKTTKEVEILRKKGFGM